MKVKSKTNIVKGGQLCGDQKKKLKFDKYFTHFNEFLFQKDLKSFYKDSKERNISKKVVNPLNIEFTASKFLIFKKKSF